MNAKSIMIIDIDVQYSAEYIAYAIWEKEIARVSSITLIPQIKNGEISHIAYIEIESFSETETAYKFIMNLNRGFGYILSHDDTDIANLWFIEKNVHNSGKLQVGQYTTVFTPKFYKNFILDDDEDDIQFDTLSMEETFVDYDDFVGEKLSIEDLDTTCANNEEYICDEEEWEEFILKRPIKGLSNDYYTIEEAIERVSQLHYLLNKEHSFNIRVVKIEEEIMHFDKELVKHDATTQSNFITLRSYHLYKEMIASYQPETTKEFHREVPDEWFSR